MQDGHESYPDRPILLMLSFGAGGVADFQACIVSMTARNEDALGMPIPIIRKPGGLTFSGAGLFVGHRIAAVQLEKAAGVKLAYIPNKKGGLGAMKALIAGEVLGGVNFRGVMVPKETPQLIIVTLAETVPTMLEHGGDAGTLKAAVARCIF